MTKDWTPQPRVQEDVISQWPAQALAATLGAPAPETGDTLPPGWHWSYFLEAVAPDQIGIDGHPRRGDFLPPIEHLPRRMYAGGKLRWFRGRYGLARRPRGLPRSRAWKKRPGGPGRSFS